MRKMYVSYYEAVVAFCVSLTIAAQAIYNQFAPTIIQTENNTLGFIFEILVSLGLFGFLYGLLIYSYKTITWKLIHRNYFIAGKWDGIITKFRGEESNIYVDLNIYQTFENITLNAINYLEE